MCHNETSYKHFVSSAIFSVCRGAGRMASRLSLVKPLCLSAKWQRLNSVVPFPIKMFYILAGSPFFAPAFFVLFRQKEQKILHCVQNDKKILSTHSIQNDKKKFSLLTPFRMTKKGLHISFGHVMLSISKTSYAHHHLVIRYKILHFVQNDKGEFNFLFILLILY